MSENNLQKRIVEQLEGGQAHVELPEAVDNLPRSHRCKTPDDLPYSVWDLVEHIRLAQADIIEFSTGPEYESKRFPEDFWPEETDQVSDGTWNQSLNTISSDLNQMIDLIKDSEQNLLTPFPWGDGQTLFRQAMLLIDHRSYHIGQIVVVRRMLGVWNNNGWNMNG